MSTTGLQGEINADSYRSNSRTIRGPPRLPAARCRDGGWNCYSYSRTLRTCSSPDAKRMFARGLPEDAKQDSYSAFVGRAPSHPADARRSVCDPPRRHSAPRRRGGSGNTRLSETAGEGPGGDIGIPEIALTLDR